MAYDDPNGPTLSGLPRYTGAVPGQAGYVPTDPGIKAALDRGYQQYMGRPVTDGASPVAPIPYGDNAQYNRVAPPPAPVAPPSGGGGFFSALGRALNPVSSANAAEAGGMPNPQAPAAAPTTQSPFRQDLSSIGSWFTKNYNPNQQSVNIPAVAGQYFGGTREGLNAVLPQAQADTARAAIGQANAAPQGAGMPPPSTPMDPRINSEMNRQYMASQGKSIAGQRMTSVSVDGKEYQVPEYQGPPIAQPPAASNQSHVLTNPDGSNWEPGVYWRVGNHLEYASRQDYDQRYNVAKMNPEQFGRAMMDPAATPDMKERMAAVWQAVNGKTVAERAASQYINGAQGKPTLEEHLLAAMNPPAQTYGQVAGSQAVAGINDPQGDPAKIASLLAAAGNQGVSAQSLPDSRIKNEALAMTNELNEGVRRKDPKFTPEYVEIYKNAIARLNSLLTPSTTVMYGGTGYNGGQ